jgi:hypothetical protein
MAMETIRCRRARPWRFLLVCCAGLACQTQRADEPPAVTPQVDVAGAGGTAPPPTGASADAVGGAAGTPAIGAAGAAPGAAPPAMPATPGETDEGPESCEGFPLRGLQYSPGGSVLPDTCKPYDPITNNPFAVRCIDADPSYATGFPGDEYCILPPPPELGLQFGVHPKSHAPADTAAFTLGPGEETNQNYFAKASNTEVRYFLRSNVRMRTGSHHLISTGGTMPMEDGWEGDRQSAGIGILAPGFETTLPSAQRPEQNTPPGLTMPPENEGIAFKLAANQQMQFNLHHFNPSDRDILREVWINVWFIPEAEVKQVLQPLALIGALADVQVPPGEMRKLVYGCSFEDARMMALTGHRHASTDRFGIWLEQDGQDTPLYESFDYNDMPTFDYDSLTQNPMLDLATKTDGAYSGPLYVKGGTLKWTCEIHNRQDTTLTFSNELYTGEMCIVFGAYLGSQPSCDFGVLHYELLPLLGPLTDFVL